MTDQKTPFGGGGIGQPTPPSAVEDSLMELAADGVFIIAAQGDIVHGNPAGCRMTGYSLEQLRQKNIQDMIDREQRSNQQEAMRMLESQRSYVVERKLVSAAGDRIDVEISVAPLPDGRGLCIVHDLTRRKRYERALADEEQKYRSLVDTLPVAVTILQDDRIAFANAASIALLGYESLAELQSVELPLLLAETERERVFSYIRMRQAGSDSAPEQYQTSFRHKDGSQVPVEVLAHTIRYQGRPAIQAVGFDISRRLEAEQALKRSEEVHRRLVNLSPNGITLADLEGQVVFANSRAAVMQGFGTAEEMLAADFNIFDSIPDADRPEVERAVRSLLDPDNAEEIQIRRIGIKLRDGNQIMAEVWATIVPDEQGQPEGILTIVRDITDQLRAEREQQELQEQFQQSQKLESLGVLAGGIAHDFNNLLLGILGNASLALLDTPLDSAQRILLDRIESAAQQAASLTHQMLTYSGRSHFEMESLFLDRLVEDTSRLLQTALSRKVEMTFAFDDQLQPVTCDASQIRQVIMNLITNASEAIGEAEGRITISTGACPASEARLSAAYLDATEQVEQLVFLRVSDDGQGMDEETQARIFDPFYTTKFTGRGLGLAAVLGIIRGHKGAIQVDSEPGRGTTFTVFFPSASSAQGQVGRLVEESSGPAQLTGSGRLILADDDPIVGDTVQAILERAGFKVTLARDGQQVLDLVNESGRVFDLLVLDLTMPRLNGLEVYAQIRQDRPQIPILLSSGYAPDRVSAQIEGDPGAAFIQKPYTAGQLVAQIISLLGADA